ncbi:hypothetical protein CR51_08705 [Caballeronia megalochromosomata]|nr:hypothetical protein CR51_08705 [Caballeronia megalochromosomata]
MLETHATPQLTAGSLTTPFASLKKRLRAQWKALGEPLQKVVSKLEVKPEVIGALVFELTYAREELRQQSDLRQFTRRCVAQAFASSNLIGVRILIYKLHCAPRRCTFLGCLMDADNAKMLQDRIAL